MTEMSENNIIEDIKAIIYHYDMEDYTPYEAMKLIRKIIEEK